MLINLVMFFLDYILTTLVLITTTTFLLIRCAVLFFAVRLIPSFKYGGNNNIFRIIQGDFEIIKKKDVFFSFYEDLRIFKHLYIICFPANRRNVIHFGEKMTFIDIPLKARLIKKIGLPMCYAILGLFFYYWSILDLVPLVRKSASLIRGSDPHHTGIAAIVLGFICKTPYCISIHSDYDLIFESKRQFYISKLFLPAQKLRKFVERLVLSNAENVIAISDFIRAYALRSGARVKKIHVLYHGVIAQRFKNVDVDIIKERFSWQKKCIVITVSRISKEKAIFDIPDIAQCLNGFSDDLLFVIVGDGPDNLLFKEKISQLNLDEKIKLIGWQNQDTVAAIRCAADVNLCLYDGYSLIEAAMSLRPIVAYDVEWHSELIKNEETGILVPNRNIAAAALAIKRLLNDPSLSNMLGKKANELAMRNHEMEKATKRKEDFYRTIMLRNKNTAFLSI